MCIVECRISLLADPREARGCSTNTSVTNSLTHSLMVSGNIFTAPSCPSGLKMVLLVIKYVNVYFEILNLKGHLNCFIGSKVTAILVNGGGFYLVTCGEVALGRVCTCSLRSRLDLFIINGKYLDPINVNCSHGYTICA